MGKAAEAAAHVYTWERYGRLSVESYQTQPQLAAV